jgi:hypothetical protein
VLKQYRYLTKTDRANNGTKQQHFGQVNAQNRKRKKQSQLARRG